MEVVKYEEKLKRFSYRYLQYLSKLFHLPANLKKVHLIKMITTRKFGTDADVDKLVARYKQHRRRKPVTNSVFARTGAGAIINNVSAMNSKIKGPNSTITSGAIYNIKQAKERDGLDSGNRRNNYELIMPNRVYSTMSTVRNNDNRHSMSISKNRLGVMNSKIIGSNRTMTSGEYYNMKHLKQGARLDSGTRSNNDELVTSKKIYSTNSNVTNKYKQHSVHCLKNRDIAVNSAQHNKTDVYNSNIWIRTDKVTVRDKDGKTHKLNAFVRKSTKKRTETEYIHISKKINTSESNMTIHIKNVKSAQSSTSTMKVKHTADNKSKPRDSRIESQGTESIISESNKTLNNVAVEQTVANECSCFYVTEYPHNCSSQTVYYANEYYSYSQNFDYNTNLGLYSPDNINSIFSFPAIGSEFFNSDSINTTAQDFTNGNNEPLVNSEPNNNMSELYNETAENYTLLDLRTDNGDIQPEENVYLSLFNEAVTNMDVEGYTGEPLFYKF